MHTGWAEVRGPTSISLPLLCMLQVGFSGYNTNYPSMIYMERHEENKLTWHKEELAGGGASVVSGSQWLLEKEEKQTMELVVDG